MSPVRPNFDPENLYFVTTTTTGRAHIFQRDVIKRIIVDSFRYLRRNKIMKLYAFVILPNHIHYIGMFHGARSLSEVMRDFKKHTARQIIRQLQVEKDQRMLVVMLKAAQNIHGQDYKVWERGYDARDIFSREFLQQKLDYLHHNPCQEQWRLVEKPETYIWSSARFYLLDQPAIIDVDDVRELF